MASAIQTSYDFNQALQLRYDRSIPVASKALADQAYPKGQYLTETEIMKFSNWARRIVACKQDSCLAKEGFESHFNITFEYSNCGPSIFLMADSIEAASIKGTQFSKTWDEEPSLAHAWEKCRAFILSL